jgi:hypothetical protein
MLPPHRIIFPTIRSHYIANYKDLKLFAIFKYISHEFIHCTCNSISRVSQGRQLAAVNTNDVLQQRQPAPIPKLRAFRLSARETVESLLRIQRHTYRYDKFFPLKDHLAACHAIYDIPPFEPVSLNDGANNFLCTFSI